MLAFTCPLCARVPLGVDVSNSDLARLGGAGAGAAPHSAFGLDDGVFKDAHSLRRHVSECHGGMVMCDVCLR